jgi:hypothetical protein
MTSASGSDGDGLGDEGAGVAPLRLTSEFASVVVAADEHANGPRLRVEDLRNGRVIYLDPLELASLTWLSHDRLGPFLDPSQTGWRS